MEKPSLHKQLIDRLQKFIEDRGVCLMVEDLDETISHPPETDAVKVTGSGGRLIVKNLNGINPQTKIVSDSRDSLIWIEEGTTLAHCNINVKGKGNLLYIGKNCRLKQLTISMKGNDCTIALGEGTTTEQVTMICGPAHKSILVGDDGMISSGVVIRTDDGHGVFDSKTGERIGLPSDVTIHAHVWLGNGSRINKGCTIGSGTIVGQVSVLSGDAEANSIYAGIPARKLRDGILWSRTTNIADIPSRFRNLGTPDDAEAVE